MMAGSSADSNSALILNDSGKHVAGLSETLVPKDILPKPDEDSQKVVVLDDCIVLLNGQRCHLKVNPESGVLVAYPIEPSPAENAEPPESFLTEIIEHESTTDKPAEANSSPQTDHIYTTEFTTERTPPLVEVIEKLPATSLQVRSHQRPPDTTPIATKRRQLSSVAVSQCQPRPVENYSSDSTLSIHILSENGSIIEKSRERAINEHSNETQTITANTSSVGSALGLKLTQEELDELKCPRCQFQGLYQQQFTDHLKEQHADELHRCKCCGFVSLDEPTLLGHYKDHHPRNICVDCNIVSEHAYVIKRHVTGHKGGIVCDICGKSYKDKYILQMHVKVVHMPAEVLYECNVCNRSYNRKAHLNRHIRIHTEKQFKCEQCDYRGAERSDVTKHALVHAAPKFACEICGKTFRHNKNKGLHMKRHAGQRDYKCGVCEFYGYTFTDIRKHIERRHTDIKSFICDKCGGHFKTEHSFTEHIKLWHSNGSDVSLTDQSSSSTQLTQISISSHNPNSTMAQEEVEAALAGSEQTLTGDSVVPVL